MAFTGTLVTFSYRDAYGFIRPDGSGGGRDVYVSGHDCPGVDLVAGMRLKFDTTDRTRGKNLRAINVEVAT